MSSLNALVQDFLAQKRIAIVGVSGKRETGCNLAFRTFQQRGYEVIPVNPHLATFDGAPCYPDLMAIPQKPDAVFILANPRVTDQVVDHCLALGIRHVWMHCMQGTKPGLGAKSTSVSADAVAKCRAQGIAVIPGSCPNQFLGSDGGHRFMRHLFGWIGWLRAA